MEKCDYKFSFVNQSQSLCEGTGLFRSCAVPGWMESYNEARRGPSVIRKM